MRTQHRGHLLLVASRSLFHSPRPDSSRCPLASVSPDANSESIPSSKLPPGRHEDEQRETPV